MKSIPVFTDKIDVQLIQQMGGDHMVVAAAKVSTNGTTALEWANPDNVEECVGLIGYLMKQRHGTPFEHSALTFFVHAPIFVWREWHRHRIGHCLPGDTEIWQESYAPKSGRTVRKRKLSTLYTNFNFGVTDNKGRTRHLPSVKNQKLRVLNEKTGIFELGSIDAVIQSGVKEIFRIETNHYKHKELKATKDHLVLTQVGWKKFGDIKEGDYVAVVGKVNKNTPIPPSLRSGIGVWTTMQRGALIKSTDYCYLCHQKFLKQHLILDHVIPVVTDLQKSLDTANLKPCCKKCHRLKTNGEQKYANRDLTAGNLFVKVINNPTYVNSEMTYDICMKGPHHNFVANGFVVHNSFNEESARYKQLDPVFWIPKRERKLLPIENFKSARPEFRQCSVEEYAWLIDDMKTQYINAYTHYQERIDKGFAREVARAALPVGIYSSCWVTVNPRSLMAFLSLRTHEPESKFVSYPQAEIEEAARMTEEIFAQHWPITYAAFNKFGRVGP